MTSIVFYFQVHQPFRLRRYGPDDVGKSHEYFDDAENERIVKRIAERCYVPVNEILARKIDETGGEFRCSFSISGTALDQMELWAPEALESFIALSETGSVEFLCETACHSMSSLVDMDEFRAQVESHRRRIEALFGRAPRTFRNTELVVDEEIARAVEDMGFDVLLGEGADQLLGWRSPHLLYRPAGCQRLELMLRDYLFSDDIAFRFSNREWPEYPLMADTFAGWLHRLPPQAVFCGLFMDYETFGEHQWAETGILDFLDYLPGYVLADPSFRFRTPIEVADENEAAEVLGIPRPISWADAERDVSAWLGNPMQRTAHEALYELGPRVRRAAEAGHAELLVAWRRLTTSDHVYYMSTKWHSDGDVHEYFSPYQNPSDAFVNFMNVLDDLSGRVDRILST